jgi:hypothetical protein
MKKILTKLNLFLLLWVFLISCEKKDLKNTNKESIETQKSSVKSANEKTIESIKNDSLSAQLNLSEQRPQLSPNNTKEKPLTSKNTHKPTEGSISTLSSTIYSCGSFLSGSYYGTGYYSYEYNNFDLIAIPNFSTINISVSSYDVPNRFSVYDVNNNFVASSGWMGYAQYPGPWGMSLNTTQSKTLTFNKGTINSYTLRVETVTQYVSDAWEAGINCIARVLDYTQLSIEHNNALDNLHLNYSTGGTYNLQSIYNATVNYSNANNKQLPFPSYQQLVNLKNQSSNVSSFLNALQTQLNAFDNIEISELNTLYQSLIAATSDNAIDVVIQNFNTHINQSNYTLSQKNKLLGVTTAIYTIADFWAATDEDFMDHPGETRTWQQRATDPITLNLNRNNEVGLPWSSLSMQSLALINTNYKNLLDESNFFRKRCRIFCVICVAFNDAIGLVAFGALMPGNPVGAALGATLWSVIARCCGVCGRTCDKFQCFAT